MRFFVSQRFEPGVYRPDVGLVKPGSVLDLRPGETPHPFLVPMDVEAQAALMSHHGVKVPLLPANPAPPTGNEMTFREYTENRLGMKPDGKKSGRAADR